MIVYYRLSNIPSSNPSPIYQDDKKKLNMLCLRSFVTAFREIKPKIVFIADYCGREYQDLIDPIVPFEHEIIYTAIGINGTALKQYELAHKSTEDIILFQECDYLYRPSTGKIMNGAIKHFGLVSPYDHPDFYTRYDIHDKKVELEVLNETHFRTTTRNTMTFGMTREAFEKQYEILKKYGYLDNEVWKEMRENGNQLYTPIPGFATHMAGAYMSSAIPWNVLIELYK